MRQRFFRGHRRDVYNSAEFTFLHIGQGFKGSMANSFEQKVERFLVILYAFIQNTPCFRAVCIVDQNIYGVIRKKIGNNPFKCFKLGKIRYQTTVFLPKICKKIDATTLFFGMQLKYSFNII